jgi:hypothetical protein
VRGLSVGRALACCVVLGACHRPIVLRDRPSQAVISADEIRSARWTTAYEIVEHLRPRFLQSRGPVSLEPTAQVPDVSIDLAPAQTADALRDIQAASVFDIRLLDRWEAQRLLGGTHPAGTILVRIRRVSRRPSTD